MSQYRTHTAIVMMDTRPAQLAADAPTAELDYPQLAFELNRGYACQHGYDLLYLRMQAATCRHELLGERHPSYCKLAAVAEALHRGYTLVAFLDSDAFFHNLTLSVPQLLSLHRGSRLGGGTSAEPAAASFGVDQPFSFGSNGGVQFWRNTADAARLLRLWWHLPGGRVITGSTTTSSTRCSGASCSCALSAPPSRPCASSRWPLRSMSGVTLTLFGTRSFRLGDITNLQVAPGLPCIVAWLPASSPHLVKVPLRRVGHDFFDGPHAPSRR